MLILKNAEVFAANDCEYKKVDQNVVVMFFLEVLSI